MKEEETDRVQEGHRISLAWNVVEAARIHIARLDTYPYIIFFKPATLVELEKTVQALDEFKGDGK